MRKVPVVDIALCTLCEGCIGVCPSVFRYNSVMDYMEVVDLDNYPEDEVDEAIRDCPEDCISWENE
nr:ferredoxin [Desulfobulbaceae bacterium]